MFCVHVCLSFNLCSISGIVIKIWWEQGGFGRERDYSKSFVRWPDVVMNGKSSFGTKPMGLSLYFHLAVCL